MILSGSDCDTESTLHVLQNSLQNRRFHGHRVKLLTFVEFCSTYDYVKMGHGTYGSYGCALFKSWIAKNRIRMQRNVKRFQRMPVQ